MTKKTIYFGYGSNLWRDQMNKRCPQNKLFGVGELKGWKWIINIRGYANIIPSPDHAVYGLLYELTEEDEKHLDRFENVGRGDAYDKASLTVNLIPAEADSDIEEIIVMSYIDHKRVEEGKVLEEYIGRMEKAIEDGIEEGIPEEYFELNVRPSLLSS